MLGDLAICGAESAPGLLQRLCSLIKNGKIPSVDEEAVPLATGAAIVLECDQVLGVGFILLAAFLFWVYPKRATFGFFLFALSRDCGCTTMSEHLKHW